MIFGLATDLKSRLAASNFPLDVTCGRLLVGAAGTPRFGNRVELVRDEEIGDLIRLPPQVKNISTHDLVRVRSVAYRATIYATCPSAGATQQEHHAEVNRYTDAVIVCLVDWAQSEQIGIEIINPHRPLTASELQSSEFVAAAAVLLQFRLDRAVLRRDYRRTPIPLADFTDLTVDNTVQVTLDGQSYEDVP